MRFRFEKLDVWRKAVEYAGEVYEATRRFPADERFGLTSQLRRAVVSISSNIAEGSGRSSDKEYLRFIEIAYGSLMEVVSQLRIARGQSFLSLEDSEHLDRLADELARMLSGFRSRLLDSKNE